MTPVFNVVKLSAAPDDPIPGRKPRAPPPPIVVNGEPEWEVEEVLDSRWHWRRFQFLIKWKGFSREHNSWEVASDVKVPDLVAEYYRKHPAAPRHICCKGDWSGRLQEIPQLIIVNEILLQPTSRRFLRELDEAPGGNNLHYILQCLRIPALVTRV